MSGHSKWAQIKRQKGVQDVKRGLTFTKISNAITIAVRQGGGVTDPSQNFRLRLAIEAARSANMPKENIQRAIERAAGKGAGELTQITYEGFAPGGVAIIVEAATDNSQRTTSAVKNIFTKAGANFGQPGTVSYQFQNLGEILIPKGSKTFDEVFMDVSEAGADDLEEEDEHFVVYTNPHELSKVKDELVSKGHTVSRFDLILKPINTVLVEGEGIEKLDHFVTSLEALDDVQKVYTNAQ